VTLLFKRLASEGAMNHESYPDEYIAGILHEARSFAIVGASANKVRPSYFVLKYLLAKGYRVFPVNPGLAGEEILGQKVYSSLAALEGPVDVVEIFRNSDAALGIVREALALKDRLHIKVIWMQLSVRNDEAARLAEEAGLKVVMNRCPKIEYGRLSGEIGWAGVNNGMISAKKPLLLGKGFQQLSIGNKS
jgi:predicted CoA-binding protein